MSRVIGILLLVSAALLLYVPAMAYQTTMDALVSVQEGGVDYGTSTYALNVDVTDLGGGLYSYQLSSAQSFWLPTNESVTFDDLQGLNDPTIGAAIAVTDFGDPTIFGFVFSTPVLPLSGLLAYSVDLSGTFTDGTDDGGSIGPASYATVGSYGLNSFADQLASLGPGAAFSPGASGAAYGPYHTAGTYLVGSANSMQIGLSFAGSGGGDMYSLSTTFNVNPVPEPGTLALFGFGLASAAASYRRKRAAKKA